MNKATREQELAIARANNMNVDEGHLGGYIRASADAAPSGLNVEHGDPATWSPKLWLWTFTELGTRSVLDVGCGEGHCAGFFRNLGCEVLGVDGSIQAKRDSVIAEYHVVHDYTDGPFLPEREFDLVWSCEFFEHVKEEYLENFLQSFSRSRRFVMLTYASPGQPGWHHVNCQPADYWIAAMRRIGFTLDDHLTSVSRSVAEPGHYRAKGLCFIRQ